MNPTRSFFLDPVDPAGYTAMLQAAYTAIKDVDDSVLVIGGTSWVRAYPR